MAEVNNNQASGAATQGAAPGAAPGAAGAGSCGFAVGEAPAGAGATVNCGCGLPSTSLSSMAKVHPPPAPDCRTVPTSSTGCPAGACKRTVFQIAATIDETSTEYFTC